MLLAHGGAAGGPNYEALVLAVPMVVVGVILFVQKSAKPMVSVVLVLGGIALALGGFTFLSGTDEHDDARAGKAPDPRYAVAVEGLCDARDRLEDGDPDAARAAFFDDSHGALHEIADRVTEENRSAAADLLEAKQAVEEGFEASGEVDPEEQGGRNGSESLQSDVDRLIIATVRGLAEIDVAVKGCD